MKKDKFRNEVNENMQTLEQYIENGGERMKHIDEWIEEMAMLGSKQEKYAAFFFHLKRLPAFMIMGFEPYTKQFKLFCDYNGKAHRVTGASRMGDVWLAKDFEQENGYDERVDVALCSNWRKEAKE